MKNIYLKIVLGIYFLLFLGDIVCYWMASLNGVHNEVAGSIVRTFPFLLILAMIYFVSFVVYVFHKKTTKVDAALFVIFVLLSIFGGPLLLSIVPSFFF